jgi:farnesyl-diphosphate farnesyltransferase
MRTLPRDLDRILRGTSRSFYLTLRVAPGGVRRQLGLSYLFCRAADTIADTALLPAARRLELLAVYRAQFEAEEPREGAAAGLAAELTGARALPDERHLLGGLERCFAVFRALPPGDRNLIRKLVTTLTRGMETDLKSFPPAAEPPRREGNGLGTRADPAAASPPVPEPLPDEEALDRYCYHVAGCVGEFWTDLAAQHLPALASWDLAEMREKGVRFGKGLQMTNILRDLPSDLRLGRSYLPRTLLEHAGVTPRELRGGGRPEAPLPRKVFLVIDHLLDITLGHYQAGWEYTLAIPARAPRLRLACAWPLLIGIETLSLIRSRPEVLLAGGSLKVPRPRVRQLLRLSAARVFSRSALDRLFRRLERRALPAGG